MSWPLPSPLPASTPAPIPPANSRSITVVTPTRPIPNYRSRLSAPTKDASEDYHDFIEAVGKSSRTPVFDEPADDAPTKAKTRCPLARNAAKTTSEPRRIPIGTTRLVDHGRMRLIPLPSPHPCDPLNLPPWRKWAAVAAMSLVGGLAVGMLAAFDNLQPVFALEYAGVGPQALQDASFTTLVAHGSTSASSARLNMTTALAPLLPPAGTLPPTDHIRRLASLPLLTTAAAGYIQVALSEAVGRRPVLLLSTACAWAGALWAALSSSSAAASLASLASGPSALTQHTAARALIGVGAASVNALIPLVAAHDLCFMHERHRVLAVSTALQALVVAGIVAMAPYVAVAYDWRWLYAGAGVASMVAWLGVVALVPETRWTLRTRAQLCGTASTAVFADELAAHRRLARLDYYGYGARTLWTDVGMFMVRPFGAWQWARGGRALLDMLRTALLPPVLWVAAVQAVLLVAGRAVAELTVDTLLLRGAGVAFAGLAGSAWAVAAVLGGMLSGAVVGDACALGVTQHVRAHQKQKYQRLSVSVMAAAEITKTSRAVLNAKLRSLLRQQMTVRREAEHVLPGLVLPFAMGIAGSFFFGVVLYKQQSSMDWMLAALVAASSFLATAVFLFFVGSSVFLIESYPVWAGPCLAHAHSLRHVAAYAMSGAASDDTFRSRPVQLIAKIGALAGWSVFAEVLLVLSLGLPALWFSGRWIRAWAAGSVAAEEEDEDDDDDDDDDRDDTPRMTNESELHWPKPPDMSSAQFTSYDARPPSLRPPPIASRRAATRSERYTAPHPGTRADIGYPRESQSSAMAGRAL